MGRYVAWPPSEELVALLARAQQGDSRDRDDLLTALRPPLFAFFCYRLPQDAAEDLAQIALIRIARAIPRIDPVRADRYVTTVARNLLRSAFRRHADAGRRFVGDSGIDRAASFIPLLPYSPRHMRQSMRTARRQEADWGDVAVDGPHATRDRGFVLNHRPPNAENAHWP